MTANELADHLATEWIKHEKDVGILMKTSAEFLYTQITMLRQQQAEIKDLKQQVAFLEDWRDTWSPFLKAITGKVNDERK